jgi:hypothetical protein
MLIFQPYRIHDKINPPYATVKKLERNLPHFQRNLEGSRCKDKYEEIFPNIIRKPANV